MSAPTWSRLSPKVKEGGILFLGLLHFSACLHLFSEYVAEVRMCVGPSMVPTFNSKGDIVVLEKISTQLGKLKPGDIVVATSPSDPKQTVCKRIAAIAGETVLRDPRKPHGEIHLVPPGHLWLLGDNLSNSTDSRSYGAVPMALVQGRVLCKIFPPSEAAFMSTAALPGYWRLLRDRDHAERLGVYRSSAKCTRDSLGPKTAAVAGNRASSSSSSSSTPTTVPSPAKPISPAST
eukprot:Clim_evm2s128 gene=Clim_evmTU2s128